MESEIILSTENIKKHFTGTYALRGVSVELKKGEIHALVGENGAGKSTLMNIISGVLTADEGNIYLEGKLVHFRNPDEAQKNGIGFVHQELALCPELSVEDNVFIGHLPQKSGMIDRNKLDKDTRQVLSLFGDKSRNIDPRLPVNQLSVAQQQIVEIAKALSHECKVLIFDEPTSSLNEEEAEDLFKIIHDLARKGLGIFYISHKMDEIFKNCDRITIMRDGQKIDTVDVSNATEEYVVSNMVGKELGSLYPPKSTSHGKEILRVENITRQPFFRNVSFTTYAGEILGLCGLVGAGRSEIARAVCGIDKKQEGRVFLEGKELNIRCCRDAQNYGICYLTEERKKDGLFLEMSLSENMIAPQIRAFSRNGFVIRRKAEETTEYYRKLMDIKYSSVFQKIGSLSGGNQQKLMLSKILAMHPKVVFLDEPTRGIDVGAKAEIHQLLRKLSDEGIGVVVISSEMPEMVGVCDRVVVINVGNIVGEISGEELTQESVVAAISSNKE